MTVFTVYFCGTGSTRLDLQNDDFWNGELIATLANHHEGREFADWIVIDGPGSGNLQEDELWSKPGGYFDLTGKAFGSGWEENVRHACNIIKGRSDWQRTQLSEEQYKRLKDAGIAIADLEATGSFLWRTYDYGPRKVTQQQLQAQIIKTFRKGGPIPTQVNLVGWSRGGISCHMLANAMAADPELIHIPVNIFVVDAVPGALNFQPEKVTLAGNVKEYVGFYARDERSAGFTCVVPSATAETHMSIFPMPGRHATLVGNASENGASGASRLVEPGEIVRHCAEVCLTRWGVSLREKLKYDSSQLEARYARMLKQQPTYVSMREHSYTTLRDDRNGERCVCEGANETNYSSVNNARVAPGLAEHVMFDEGHYQRMRGV